MTAKQIAEILDLAPNSVRHLARREGWPFTLIKVGVGRPERDYAAEAIRRWAELERVRLVAEVGRVEELRRLASLPTPSE